MGMHLNWLLELRTHWHGTRATIFSGLILLGIVLGLRIFLKFSPKAIAQRYGLKLFLLTFCTWSVGQCLNGILRGLETYSRAGKFAFAGFEELGGIFLSVLAIQWFCRRESLSAKEVLDAYALGALAFLTVGALGCFVVGCCDGLPTQVRWAIAGPSPLPGAQQQYFHPTQLYAALGYAFIFLLTRHLFSLAPKGQRFLFACTGVFFLRFMLQYHKQNHESPMSVAGLDDLQLTALAAWTTTVLPGFFVQIRSGRAFKVLRESRGFNLVELMFVIILLGILYKVYTAQFGNNLDAQKFEETRAQLEAIRTAILGDTSQNAQGKRTRFGYYGDMGSLPGTLADLVTIGAQPAWSYSTWHRVGIGWRGPYITEGPTGSITYTKDAWGNNIYYDTSLPATIRSYGSDNAASGSGYATDMTISIPSTDLLSTVKVLFAEQDLDLTGAVNLGRIYYPSAGVWVDTGLGAMNNYGDLSFSNIPIGVRSIWFTWVQKPFAFTVDRAQTLVGPFNLQGLTRSITFTAGTRNRGSSANIVQATLSSNHGKDLVLSSVAVGAWVGGPANLTRIGVNGMSQTVSPAIARAAGGTITVNTRLIFVANQSVNLLELEFDGDATGLAALPSLTFYYANAPGSDSVNIS